MEGSNEGNFIQLVRFRAETDTVLSGYLATAPKNARYTSKTIQNELLSVVGRCIRDDIIAEVKSAKYYSIIADETTDTAGALSCFSICSQRGGTRSIRGLP